MTTGTIRLDAIVASKTNPRKHFDKAALQELAESIGKHGVLQPILVRPNGTEGNYELVAGERRWRAAQIAKLDRIPATVRELADAEVLEIQVVENLQRADLHPLEEAEGYEALMKCQHADGHAYTADEIAAKVGKSRSYVYQRLKLTALTPKAREAFYAGRLDASKALLVARVPEALQDEVLERLIGDEDDYVPSFRAAREIIHNDFMLELKRAPFDVKAIYFAGNQANPIGPACAECPKRTGNQPQLFDDVKSGDICTDPGCFHAKAAAAHEQEAEKLRAKGYEVLTGDAARKVMPNTWNLPRGGYVAPDTVLLGAPDGKTIAKLLGKKLPLGAMVEHPSGDKSFVHLVKESEVRAALVEAGHAWAGEKSRAKALSDPGDDHAAPRDARLSAQELQADEAIQLAIHKALREAVRRDGLTEEDIRNLLATMLDVYQPDPCIEAFAGKEAWEDITAAPAAELVPMLIDCMFSEPYEYQGRKHMAERHGVDVKALTALVQAEVKAQAKAEKEAAKGAKPAKAKKAKKATQPEEADA